jgi:hypothetical protein
VVEGVRYRADFFVGNVLDAFISPVFERRILAGRAGPREGPDEGLRVEGLQNWVYCMGVYGGLLLPDRSHDSVRRSASRRGMVSTELSSQSESDTSGIGYTLKTWQIIAATTHPRN